MAKDQDLAKILGLMKKKQMQLRSICRSDFPISPAFLDRYYMRVSKSYEYLKELDELFDALECLNGAQIKLLPIHLFNKAVQSADIVNYCIEGSFVKLAEIAIFPFDTMYVVWTAGITSL